MGDISSSDWIQVSITIMDTSMSIGSKLYPFICGLGLLRMIVENV